jgi:hypothetical protein
LLASLRLAFVERQLELEQEANRENRRIIAGLVQRVPELEAAPEHRDGPVPPFKGNGRDDVHHDQERRPGWWRRFFGFE